MITKKAALQQKKPYKYAEDNEDTDVLTRVHLRAQQVRQWCPSLHEFLEYSKHAWIDIRSRKLAYVLCFYFMLAV